MWAYFQTIKKHRFLLYYLTWSQFKSRFRMSFLGWIWVVIQPLILLIPGLILFKNIETGSSYVLVALAGLWPWSFLATSISLAIPTVVSQAALIKKINFSREFLIYAVVLVALADYLIGGLILMLIWHLLGGQLSGNILYLIPLSCGWFLMVVAWSLIGAGLNVIIRDVQKLLPIILQSIFFISPVIYPTTLVPDKWRVLYQLNPVTGYINSYRQILINQTAPLFSDWFYPVVFSIVLFVLALVTFKKGENIYSDLL